MNWRHHEQSATSRRWKTYSLLLLHVLIDTAGVGHVLEHDLANLERAFAKPNLQDLNVSSLLGASAQKICTFIGTVTSLS
jgi:hypothetical protein